MLQAAEAKRDDMEIAQASPSAFATAAAAPVAAVARPTGARYGQRRLNLPAIAITVGLHAVLIAALVHIRHSGEHKEEQRLTVVDLRPSPPPPNPPAEQPKAPPRAAVVAPVPMLQTPRPAPLVMTVIEPPREPVEVAVAPPPPPAPPAPPSIVKADDLGTRMIAGEPPRYPVECRRRREEGTVVLALTLDMEGVVSAISIARSSGFSRLDNAALRAVRKWRWSPTLRDGRPVMVRGLVEIPFVLQG